jgi:hypothetical protein
VLLGAAAAGKGGQPRLREQGELRTK